MINETNNIKPMKGVIYMKKILCLLITVTLLFATAETAYAKKNNAEKKNKHQVTEENKKTQDKKQEFKIDDSPVIKYGKYKLPINPIRKGMGAEVTFDKKTAVLTVVKGSTKLIINLKEETVSVNGTMDLNSGIFTGKKNSKTSVLLKYIGNALGVRTKVDDDNVTVEVPGLNLPTNVKVTPVGGKVVANAINSTTLYMTAIANIIPGQATGGKAELYVGSKLVAVDTNISATDNSVTFTTSNVTTNAGLQQLIPTGGVVKVKLYNSKNESVTSAVGNPTLLVDYISPKLTSIVSATYNRNSNQITLKVVGAGDVGDKVDVTKIKLYNYSQGISYQLTGGTETGSEGVVKSSDSIVINIGSVDKLGLMSFVNTDMYLTVTEGSLLYDVAGNVSPNTTSIPPVSVTVISGLSQPYNITITPVGTNTVANTLNSSTLYMNASANIVPNQATGGRAELFVGSKLIATDTSISSTDNTVTFTTNDLTPTNAELQQLVPTGGVVTVKLYDANNNVVNSVTNPTLTVDYVAPTLTSITSAVYDVQNNKIYITVNGASAVGDSLDVTKIILMDHTQNKSYQLTNGSGSGSTGTVVNANTLLINVGTLDKSVLSSIGTTNVSLNILTGSLLRDTAGNYSTSYTSQQIIPLVIIK